jgi:hypothetical protein
MEESTVSINRLSDLANISHNTARKRLSAAGAKPNKDNRYDLGEAVRALLSSRDILEERKGLIAAQRQRVEHENDIAAGNWVHTDEIYKTFEGIFIAIRQTILASNLSDQEKHDVLKELRHDVLAADPVEGEQK